MIPPHLVALAMFTTQQAKAAGVTDFELRQATRDGVLIRLKRGWYTGSRP
ncbi:type IV toxin-antitoxin system AbiEi family antitoxin domain-containing protein [Micropruina sp.]